MNDTKYNGWTNRATWLVKLWIDNDEGEQAYWREAASEIAESQAAHPAGAIQRLRFRCLDDLAALLRSVHEERVPEGSGVINDLTGYALATVNWWEVAESLLEDAAEEVKP